MKRNILIILPRLPYPLQSGGDQAMYNSIAAVEGDCNLFVTYPIFGREGNIADREFVERSFPNVAIVPYMGKAGGLPSVWNVLDRRMRKSLLGKNGYAYSSMWSYEGYPSAFYDFVNWLIVQNHIELVQVEMYRPCSSVFYLPKSVKRIFVHHELRFVRNELDMRSVGETLERKAAVAAAKALEMAMLSEYDAVLTLSQTDRSKLLEQGLKVPVYASFSVVRQPLAVPELPCDSFSLSFLGPESHQPNKIALEWFLSGCWESLLEKDSRYNLRVIGKWSKTTVTAMMAKYKNVRFLGFVDDLRSALCGTVMVVPLTVGSGIRMKIIEAAGLGVPVVTTSVGCEGLGMENGKDCLIADGVSEFTQAVLRLRDNDFRDSVAACAKTKISSYSLPALRENRLGIYSQIFSGQ